MTKPPRQSPQNTKGGRISPTATSCVFIQNQTVFSGLPIGIRGDHGAVAVTASKNAFQRCYDPLSVVWVILRTVVFQNFPYAIPDLAGDDRLLFPFADGVFVLYLTDVCVVVQDAVNMIAPPELALPGSETRRVQFLGGLFHGYRRERLAA